MDTIIKSISEVIEMACKGFIPYKRNAFLYKDEIYEASLINKKKTSLLYHRSEDNSTSIEFHFDKIGILIYVELNPDPDKYDYEEDIILFDNRWTDELKIKTYNDLKNYKSNIYNLSYYREK